MDLKNIFSKNVIILIQNKKEKLVKSFQEFDNIISIHELYTLLGSYTQ